MIVRHDIVIRVSVDDEIEADTLVAVSDAVRLMWRTLINQDKRLQVGFGVKLLGYETKRPDVGACMGCVHAPVLELADEQEVAAA